MIETWLKLKDVCDASGASTSLVSNLYRRKIIRGKLAPNRTMLKLYCLQDLLTYLKTKTLGELTREWMESYYPHSLPDRVPDDVLHNCMDSIHVSEGTVRVALWKLRKEQRCQNM